MSLEFYLFDFVVGYVGVFVNYCYYYVFFYVVSYFDVSGYVVWI